MLQVKNKRVGYKEAEEKVPPSCIKYLPLVNVIRCRRV